MSPNAAKPSRKLNKIKNTPDTTGKTKPSGKHSTAHQHWARDECVGRGGQSSPLPPVLSTSSVKIQGQHSLQLPARTLKLWLNGGDPPVSVSHIRSSDHSALRSPEDMC